MFTKDAIANKRVETKLKSIKGDYASFYDDIGDWVAKQKSGNIIYRKPLAYNTIRLNLLNIEKVLRFLNSDYSNLLRATNQAIEELDRSQVVSKQHIANAAACFAKYLVAEQKLEPVVRDELRSIRFKSDKESVRPIVKEFDLERIDRHLRGRLV